MHLKYVCIHAGLRGVDFIDCGTHVYKAGIDVLVLFGASHELGSMNIICGVE